MTTTIANGTMHALRAGKQPRHRVVEKLRANGDRTTAVVSAWEIAWLVAHLRAVVTASPAAWAGKGMTLLQLTALHVISAQAPVALTDVAQALGTGPPATSAMVDRLIRTGLVARASDPQDRRRVQLTTTDHAKTMIGEIDLSTARCLQAALNDMGLQGRRYLIDVLRDTVRRSAGQPTKRRRSRSARARRADWVHGEQQHREPCHDA
ncbi:MAG: MarR family transcriptional regulator [Pseudonocardiales bacterium]|nr:MarR family transcriptional regulator [Pseudonocardiales bacterium]MBV9730847.1 MarR family transcriptional regulator [Pseudonocardiales bacterium]